MGLTGESSINFWEAGILIREMKISLTFQKQAYAVFFVIILSLVRGITYSDEIGIALEAPMAILAFTFCADTYVTEPLKHGTYSPMPSGS